MLKIALLLLTVAVIQASVKVVPTSNNELHPSTMELEVTLPDSNQKVLISLTKTDALEDTTITVFDNGVSRTFSASQVRHTNHSNYRDIASKSVISLRYVNGTRRISGHVMEDGISYFLEPVGEAEHRVTKNEEKFNDIAKQISRNQQKMQSRKKRQSLYTATTTYVVEIILLLDNTVWNAFKTIFLDENTALKELHFYYTHILNGIDTVFRNIGTPSISIRCIGLTLAKTAADATWMPAGENGASEILEAVQKYSVGKTADHVMAITRIDIKGKDKDKKDANLAGLAYVSRVCTDHKVSLVEDSNLGSWGIAAHELAHNLGSSHDGDKNNCDGNQNFLLKAALTAYTLANVANSYRFSACTIDAIRKHIDSMGATNCLTTNQGTPLFALSVERGSRRTLDEVCKLAYPNSIGKVFVDDVLLTNPAEMCAKIYCFIGYNLELYKSHPMLRAPAGTACGHRKSCNWNGQCVDDWAAPPADEACFWGDTAVNCDEFLRTIKNQKENKQVNAMNENCNNARIICCKTLKDICGFYPSDNRPNYQNDNNRPNYQNDNNRPNYQNDNNRPNYQNDNNRPNYQNDNNRPSSPVGDSCLDTPGNQNYCNNFLTDITRHQEMAKTDTSSYWVAFANKFCDEARNNCCKTLKHICGY